MTPLPSSAIEKGRLFSKVSRPQNIVYSGVLACLAAYAAGAGLVGIGTCYLTILLLYAVATGYNNIHDEATDKINNRHDIAQAAPRLLRRFLKICCVVLILLQFTLVQPASILITAAYLALVFAYSHPGLRIMSRGFWAVLLLSLCYGGLPFLLGALQGASFSPIQCLGMVVLQTLLIFPVVTAKDYKDIVGDTATGKLTPLVRYGASLVRKVSIAIAILAALLYSGFAHHAGIQTWLYSLLAVIYLFFIWRIHDQAGHVAKREKNTLTAAILMMAITLLFAPI